MMARTRRLTGMLFAAALATATVVVGEAAAQEAESPAREAGKHFQRAVALYGEADYRSALVEFKRAYALAPNTAVLYNVGEAEFQLQDYASALTTFRHFLAEAGPADGHRAEVENDVEVLRSRVGHVNVTTVPAGADIAVDDVPVGKTPLEDSVLVSIGHRKVVATMGGRQPVTRYVDVAADDNVAVTLPLGSEDGAATGRRPSRDAEPSDAPPPSHAGSGLRIAGWVATGVFASGAVAFGILAEKAGSDLKDARNTYPTTAAALDHDASVATTYSILADSLAAAAIVVGGITLYSTISSPSSANAPKHGSSGGARVMLGPTSARVEMAF